MGRKKLGLVLIIAGCMLWLGLGVYRVFYAQDLSFAVPPTLRDSGASVGAGEQVEIVGVLPKRIVIEKAGIDLPVFAGEIVKGKWTVVANGANHWRESAKLGEKGNVVIYGHNWKNLFGPIQGLKEGDEIQAWGENDQVFNYTITKTMSVKPTAVEIVLPTEEPQLTLYTCIGFLDKERFVVIAKPN